MQDSLLNRSIRLLVFFILVIVALYYARDFLIPVAFAGILSMLMLPISQKLEKKRLAAGISSIDMPVDIDLHCRFTCFCTFLADI